jgi:hypothetical protein
MRGTRTAFLAKGVMQRGVLKIMNITGNKNSPTPVKTRGRISKNFI